MLHRKTIRNAFAVLALMFGLVSTQVASAQNSSDRQSLDDAWWTGPMLAPSAATLPQGHFLIEPYLYDVIQQGQYDRDGVKRKAAESNGFGSLTYVNYGLTDKLTIGVIPTFGYNRVNGAPSSSSVEMGDVTVQGQYRLTKFHEGSWIPTTSFAVQETFPSGQIRPAGKPAERWTRQRRLHDDVCVLLANLFLAAESPHTSHALERIGIVFEQRECRGRQRLRNGC